MDHPLRGEDEGDKEDAAKKTREKDDVAKKSREKDKNTANNDGEGSRADIFLNKLLVDKPDLFKDKVQ